VACIDELNKEILLSAASFKECREYVEKHYTEIYYVDPGYKIFDKHIIGVPPIAIGIEQDFITFPFTKPCYGTYLLRVQDRDEVTRVKAVKQKPRR
jgi:hypothetical protein